MQPCSLPPVPGSFDHAMDHSPLLTDEEDVQLESFDWNSLIQSTLVHLRCLEKSQFSSIVCLTWLPFSLRSVRSGIENESSETERYLALQDLYTQLSSESEQGLVRATAIDHRVDRCLCLQVKRHHKTVSLHEDTASLTLVLESLALLWTKQSTTQRRKESRVRGMEILPHLLALWKNTHLETRPCLALVAIFRSWTKIQDASVKALLVKADFISALSLPFETTRNNNATFLWSHCLSLMKDMIFRASAKEVMYDAWMDHVTRALPKDECVEAATACLWNWAVDEPLAIRMASHVQLWAALALCQPKFTTKVAQKNTVSTVGSILSTCCSQLEDAPYSVQMHGDWMVGFLFQMLDDTDDDDLRRRSIRSIRCLSSCAWGRDVLQNHFTKFSELLQRLLRLLLNNQEQDDTRVQVCLAIHHWLPHLHESWSNVGPHLERSIVKTIQNESSSDKILSHAMRVLSSCFEFSPWKRGAGCLSELFFDRIHRMLQKNISDIEIHQQVAYLLWQITNKTDLNTDPPVLANPVVVDIFALLLSDMEISTAKAVECIRLAVQNDATKKCIIEHDSLLTDLVNVCIVSSGDLKAEAKALLVSLVSEL